MNRQDVLDGLIGEGPLPVIQKLVDRLAEVSRKFQAIEQVQAQPDSEIWACGCVGKRPGEPRCPCMMYNIKKIDGIWYEVSTIKILRGTRLVAERI